jgi:hypothetical protein
MPLCHLIDDIRIDKRALSAEETEEMLHQTILEMARWQLERVVSPFFDSVIENYVDSKNGVFQPKMDLCVAKIGAKSGSVVSFW